MSYDVTMCSNDHSVWVSSRDVDSIIVEGVRIKLGPIMRMAKPGWQGPFWAILDSNDGSLAVTTRDPNNQQKEQVVD